MNRMMKRFLAALLALTLTLSFSFALAEDSTQINLDLSVNPKVYQLSEQFAPVNEQFGVQPLTIVLLSAFNKLQSSLIVKNNQVSGVIGTEQGELVDVQAEVDAAVGLKGLTTSLLPGLKLSFDPDIMAAVMQEAPFNELSRAELEVYLASYGKIYEHLSGVVMEGLAKQPAVEGEYTGLLGGDYTALSTTAIDSHMMAEGFGKLAADLEGDKAAMEAFLAMMKAMSPGVNVTEAELLETLREAADNAKNEEIVQYATLLVYTSPDGRVLYEVVTTEGGQFQPLKVDVLVEKWETKPEETQAQGAVRVILPGTMDAYYQNEDGWNQAREAIVSGQDPYGTTITATYNLSHNESAAAADLGVELSHQGLNMNYKLNFSGDKAARAGQADLEVYYLLDEPVLTLKMDYSPTDQAPTAVKTEGLYNLVLKNEITGDMETQLEASFMKGWESLMEKLVVALD